MANWQRSVTLKAIREDKVSGFSCGYISKPEDFAGTMTPFSPKWEARYLGDGTAEWFDTLKEAQTWIREWGDI